MIDPPALSKPTATGGSLQPRRYYVTLATMVIRIASLVLSFAGLLALILGLLFWFGVAVQFISLHMLLGLLAVAALWVIGFAQGLSAGGSWIFALTAIVVGAATLLLGLIQSSLMVGDLHWIIRVVHLLLGLLTIGMGHMGAARARKTSPLVTSTSLS